MFGTTNHQHRRFLSIAAMTIALHSSVDSVPRSHNPTTHNPRRPPQLKPGPHIATQLQSAPSTSTCRKQHSSTSVAASQQRNDPKRRPSLTSHRGCRWRRCRNSRAINYDWRKVEVKLNALPQFITEIDGLDIHFIHVRSQHEDALPLIVNHGWSGLIIEQLKIIEPLTNPTAHGGGASDAFHIVIPSMPGYGFSGKLTTTGWVPEFR